MALFPSPTASRIPPSQNPLTPRSAPPRSNPPTIISWWISATHSSPSITTRTLSCSSIACRKAPAIPATGNSWRLLRGASRPIKAHRPTRKKPPFLQKSLTQTAPNSATRPQQARHTRCRKVSFRKSPAPLPPYPSSALPSSAKRSCWLLPTLQRSLRQPMGRILACPPRPAINGEGAKPAFPFCLLPMKKLPARFSPSISSSAWIEVKSPNFFVVSNTAGFQEAQTQTAEALHSDPNLAFAHESCGSLSYYKQDLVRCANRIPAGHGAELYEFFLLLLPRSLTDAPAAPGRRLNLPQQRVSGKST